ncbi:hypothetical protein [Maritimibacter sp. UBA3975]|nr:hypothetical protein [Maritimibacter sp. UBA3975]MAM63144.1 carboxylate--amine ligase [Maritimibacter sp.]|tara:strand:- start:11002 stop:12198 length:1197 start_codon:yes stop_codon:yes gene_type:complete
MTSTLDTALPVLLLGGEANTLEVARHFGKTGIAVEISGGSDTWGMASWHCRRAYPVPSGTRTHDFWRALLLADDHSHDGHVLFAMCDDAIDFVLENEAALRDRYRLEKFDGQLRREMLDKQRTLELAGKVGVPAPAYWPVETAADVAALAGKLTFPVMVKPIHSHLFNHHFGRKLFIVEDSFDEVVARANEALEAGLEIQIVEMIPGPDNLLSSYYTYIDDQGVPLFHFTKRVERRYPVNSGGAVYHETVWLPETAEMGLRFLRGIGWRGLANIEFKRDTRDGKLKIIEVNARFTAAHRLLVRSGAPIDLVAYCDLTGQPAPVFTSYAQHMYLWQPVHDFRAFLQLRAKGELTFGGWLASLPWRRAMNPIFSLSDPMPGVARLRHSLARQWAVRLGRG